MTSAQNTTDKVTLNADFDELRQYQIRARTKIATNSGNQTDLRHTFKTSNNDVENIASGNQTQRITSNQTTTSQ